MPTTPKARRQTSKIEDVVAYCLRNPIRVKILIVLNEGTFTAAEIATLVDEPQNSVWNHIREMVERGAIEVAKTEQVRNATKHWYRAIQMPFISDEQFATMTRQERQVTSGLIIQSMTAEVMAGLAAGRMHDDPRRVCLAWDWFNVDEQGKQDLADEQRRFWERIREIEIEATNRRAESGEEATSMLVTHVGFKRARQAPNPSRGSRFRDYPAFTD